MEKKKSSEADLERKVWVFRSLGLLIIASIVLMAFTYEAFEVEEVADVVEDDGMRDELVFDIPMDEPEPPPEEDTPPPPPPQPDEVVEVDDDVEIDEDISFDMEVTDEPILDDEPEEIVEQPIYEFADVEPAFPGGEGAMAQWLNDNIQYPQLSIEMGEQGIVYVQFVVNSDGSIEQVKVLRGVSDALDAEAKRVVKQMPKWAPGEQAGKPVRVKFTLPIHFRLG
ncbi:energy transducer TonB [Paracrocinitomix mangrovi]|uniref:energy transducer TonB n=1 Tax=Paracrocinitomix mangrovi TaxID=2862509 RepID=UPI001C8EA966|nr:energy transducer TonB [Paracrocinitomix mangrovi]UKN03415.1 energy transducer TonB [Paracrocinitomix mangrovi]